MVKSPISVVLQVHIIEDPFTSDDVTSSDKA